jgi:hypothetical protein
MDLMLLTLAHAAAAGGTIALMGLSDWLVARAVRARMED